MREKSFCGAKRFCLLGYLRLRAAVIMMVRRA